MTLKRDDMVRILTDSGHHPKGLIINVLSVSDTDDNVSVDSEYGSAGYKRNELEFVATKADWDLHVKADFDKQFKDWPKQPTLKTLTEFKIRDKVERKDTGLKGVVVEIDEDIFTTCKVDFSDGISSWEIPAKLKLIPKYKTLTEWWEIMDRRVFNALNENLIQVKIFGVDQDTKSAIYYNKDKKGYSTLDSHNPIWQVYQEPEEIQNKIDQTLHKFCQKEIESSPESEKPAEKKTETGCEHRNHEEHTYVDNISYTCKDCGVELVEKWLWIYEGISEPMVTQSFFTEEHATSIYGDKLIKKASNSRELFKAGK